MIVLTILRADGSIYWTERFNDQSSAQAWLAEEQTRSYWDPTFTHSIVDLTPAPVTPDPVAALRVKRNMLLEACDWTALTDNKLTTAQQAAWETYRQALRDLPEKTTDPANPVWPAAPA